VKYNELCILQESKKYKEICQIMVNRNQLEIRKISDIRNLIVKDDMTLIGQINVYEIIEDYLSSYRRDGCFPL